MCVDPSASLLRVRPSCLVPGFDEVENTKNLCLHLPFQRLVYVPTITDMAVAEAKAALSDAHEHD